MFSYPSLVARPEHGLLLCCAGTDAAAQKRVRDANIKFILNSGIRSVEANVVYGVATKS